MPGLSDGIAETILSWLPPYCAIVFLNIPEYALHILSAFVTSPKAWTYFAKNELHVLVMVL